MSSSALKIAAVITVLLALILAFVAYQLSRQYTQAPTPVAQQPTGEVAREPTTMAVVALQPLAAYQPIPRDAVKVAPVAVLPRDYFANVDDVIDRVPLVDIDPGAPVTGRYFKEANALARIVPEGFKAISLEINEVIAVGGFLRPGDVVDVLVFLRGGSGVSEPQARILLKDIRVLAYEDRIIDRPEGLPSESADTRRRQRTVVLAVPEADTTKLMLGMSLGDVRLAMHGQAPSFGVLDELSDAELAEADRQPLSEQAKAAQVPDQAVTAGQLSRVQPPPREQVTRHRIYVYRGSDVQTVLE
jgi:pilus assembly protein CpaB